MLKSTATALLLQPSFFSELKNSKTVSLDKDEYDADHVSGFALPFGIIRLHQGIDNRSGSAVTDSGSTTLRIPGALDPLSERRAHLAALPDHALRPAMTFPRSPVY